MGERERSGAREVWGAAALAGKVLGEPRARRAGDLGGRRGSTGGGIRARKAGAGRGARRSAVCLSCKRCAEPPREEAGASGRAAAGSSPGASAIWVRTRPPRRRTLGPAGCGLLSVRRLRPPRRRSPVPDGRAAGAPRTGACAGGQGARDWPGASGGLGRHFRRRPPHFRARGRASGRRRPAGLLPPAGGRCCALFWRRSGLAAAFPGAALGEPAPAKLQPRKCPVFARRPPVVGGVGRRKCPPDLAGPRAPRGVSGGAGSRHLWLSGS